MNLKDNFCQSLFISLKKSVEISRSCYVLKKSNFSSDWVKVSAAITLWRLNSNAFEISYDVTAFDRRWEIFKDFDFDAQFTSRWRWWNWTQKLDFFTSLHLVEDERIYVGYKNHWLKTKLKESCNRQFVQAEANKMELFGMCGHWT